jgi:hypothetical protein
MTGTNSVKDHFVNKDPSVRTLYDQLLSILQTFGPAAEDPKKTSISIVNPPWQAWRPARIIYCSISNLIIRSRARALKRLNKFLQNDSITRFEFLHPRTWMRN